MGTIYRPSRYHPPHTSMGSHTGMSAYGNFTWSYSTCVLHFRRHFYCTYTFKRFCSQLTVQVSCFLESSLRYIYYFIRKKKRKKKKTKPISFDASYLLCNHSLPNERTPNTPRHEPYQPTRNKSLDKNRSRGGLRTALDPDSFLRRFR